MQGALHEPTSFQNPLFKRAGQPRVLEDLLGCRGGARGLLCLQVPELVQKYRGEQLVARSPSTCVHAVE